jgi:hypothetical protein
MSQSMSQSRAEQDRLMEEQSLGRGDYEDDSPCEDDGSYEIEIDDYIDDYWKEPKA